MGEDVARATRMQPAIADEAGVSAQVTEAQFEEVFAAFHAAVRDDWAAHRLDRIGFTAVIRVQGADHLELWCLFKDAAEISRSWGGEQADIEVWVPASILEDFWSRHLAFEILEGRVTYTGQVRKLLQKMPVIRAAALRWQAMEVAS